MNIENTLLVLVSKLDYEKNKNNTNIYWVY